MSAVSSTTMSTPAARMLEIARSDRCAAWIRVERVRGSAPREPGASMLVLDDGSVEGTIGGGHLEFDAIAAGRRLLAAGERVATRDYVLGASLGQCCGGAVGLSLRRVDARERAWLEPLATLERRGGVRWLDTRREAGDGPHSRVLDDEPLDAPTGPATPRQADAARLVSRVAVHPWHVWVFGAGHVGEALVRVLGTMPARITWVDPRGECFPEDLRAHVTAVASDGPAHEVASIPAGADVLVMTHSHALDFDLCVALLARDDLGQVGLIGSSTKAASFRSRLARRGLDAVRIARLQCPIGVRPDDDARRDALDRHPGAIAVSVAFDLWQRRRASSALAEDVGALR